MIIVKHTHKIKKGEIYQKTKNFDFVGRGDLTSLFFSKVAKKKEVRGDLFNSLENNKGFISRPSELRKLCLSISFVYF